MNEKEMVGRRNETWDPNGYITLFMHKSTKPEVAEQVSVKQINKQNTKRD